MSVPTVLGAVVTYSSAVLQGADALNNLSKEKKSKKITDQIASFIDEVGYLLSEIKDDLNITMALMKAIPEAKKSGLSGEKREKIMQTYSYISEFLKEREKEILKSRWPVPFIKNSRGEHVKELRRQHDKCKDMRSRAEEASKQADVYEQQQLAISDAKQSLKDDDGPLSSLPLDQARLAQTIANFRQCLIHHNDYPPSDAAEMSSQQLYDLFVEALKKATSTIRIPDSDIGTGGVNATVLEVVRCLMKAIENNHLTRADLELVCQSECPSDYEDPFNDSNRPEALPVNTDRTQNWLSSGSATLPASELALSLARCNSI